MNVAPPILRFAAIAAVLGVLLPPAPGESQTSAPIVRPGAPGESSRLISAEDATRLAGIRHSEADVRFVQEMIAHHAQALEMTALVAERSDREAMRQLAGRIEGSQGDEIRMMQDWLRDRDLQVPEADAHHAHAGHVPGMLTAEDMRRLEQARGIDFDRLFLELMVLHHQGAITMVRQLFTQWGAAQDSQLFALTSDVIADQSAEITRMERMLRGLSLDPRAHLRPGFRDAGEAAWNMTLVATRPTPDGFFDPDAPAGRPLGPQSPAQAQEDEDTEPAEDGDTANGVPATTRAGLLIFANTDLAFNGTVLIQGSFHGFNAYDIEDPAAPRLFVSVVCPGGQGDVSVYGHLLFVSVEEPRARLDCGHQGVPEPASSARFRGVRIFDMSDIRMPRQVAAVQTCRGSHTHTLVNDPREDGTLYIYSAGAGAARPSEELAECSDANPAAEPNTARFSIDVIEVPLSRPEEARLVSRPRIFTDPRTGAIAGLFRGGDHGPGTQVTVETDHCHDITVFSDLGLAAGACAGNGILLDVLDPVHPVRIDAVTDPAFAYWHSAIFNHDGSKVVFTDEWGGGLTPRCRGADPTTWGANAIFDIVDRRLEFRSHYKMPAPQSEQEGCVAHNGSLVPVPGRDIMVQAWYQGGISVFDFTDSSQPFEIAFFDRGPLDAARLLLGGHWSAYWHDGYIYGSEIARGLDVLRLVPGEHLTQHEIDAARLASPEVLNPQQQRRIEWPAVPVVARAYVDQLQRSRAIAPERAAAVMGALDQADRIETGFAAAPADVAARLDTLASELAADHAGATGRDRDRLHALAETLRGIAHGLR